MQMDDFEIKLFNYYHFAYTGTDVSHIKDFEDRTWGLISRRGDLPEEFIEKYADRIHWHWLIVSQKLPEPFIEKHLDKFENNWSEIVTYQNLSPNFLEKYKENIKEYTGLVLKHQKLPMQYLEEQIQNGGWLMTPGFWDEISNWQNLSEDFIEKYSDKLDWNKISSFQHLSEEFMERNFDIITWTAYIMFNEDIPSSFFLKNYERFKKHKKFDLLFLSLDKENTPLDFYLTVKKIVNDKNLEEKNKERGLDMLKGYFYTKERIMEVIEEINRRFPNKRTKELTALEFLEFLHDKAGCDLNFLKRSDKNKNLIINKE